LPPLGLALEGNAEVAHFLCLMAFIIRNILGLATRKARVVVGSNLVARRVATARELTAA
jgi:hypothetical protein